MNTTFTNCAEKKAKQFFNLLQGYTKGIRLTAILILLLMGVNNAWGADFQGQGDKAGWISGDSDEGLILTWNKNSSTATTKMKYKSLSSGGDLGSITTGLKLTKIEAKIWRIYKYGNICSATIFWELRKGDTFISSGSEDCTKWGDWSNNNCTLSQTLDIDFLSKTTGPGIYTIRVYGKLTGRSQEYEYNDPSYLGCDDNFWYNNNNNGYYSITFTIDPVVTFKANGGTGSDYTQTVKYNTNTTLAANEFTRTNYTFAGWTTKADGSGTSYTDKQTVKLTANTTLYAKWTKNVTTYTVTYGIHSSGGGKLAATANSAAITSGTDVEENQTIVFTATPEQGYQVEGWYSDANCTAKLGNEYSISNNNNICTIQKLTKTETVFVKFKENTFDVTVTVNDAKGGTTEPSGLQSQIGQVTGMNIAANVNSGYQFIGWDFVRGAGAFGAANAASTTFKPSQESTIRAKFKANTYTVKFNANGGEGKMDNQEFTYDAEQEELTENAFTLENALFVGWATSEENANNGVVAYTNGQSVSNLTTTKDGVVNLYAVWATIEITSCSERIKTTGPLELNITYTNIPTNYYYRVMIDGTNPCLDKNNNEWISISGSGSSIKYESYETYNFVSGERSVTVEVYNNSRQKLFHSIQKTFIAEQINNIAVYYNTGNGNILYKDITGVSETFGANVSAQDIITEKGIVGYKFTNWSIIMGTIEFEPNINSETVTITATTGGQIIAHFEELQPKTIYLKTPEGTNDGATWFVEYNDNLEEMTALGCTGEYYSAEILEQTEFQFISKNNEQEVVKTINITAIPDDNRDMYVLGQKMYLKPEGAWNKSEYRFAACFKGYGDDIWVDMTDADTDGIYECIMPNEERTSVWFCIMDKNKPDNNWTNKIQQTVELPLPDNGNNYYTITADNINDWASGGTWSTHEDGANGSGEWEEFDGVTYRITLDNRGATTMGTESMDIKVGDSMLDVTLPEKTGHDFGGYFTQENGQGDMLINASGEWQNIDGYVADGEWVKEDCATLYAKWIQKRYVIAGTGSGDINWLNGHSWIDGDVTQMEDNVININEPKIYSDCSAGIKNFRIVRWGSDDQEHGIDQLDREKSSNIPFYTNEHNNISFVTIAKADITIGFDGTNITVNVEYDQDDLANVKDLIVSGENVMFYFGDEWSISDYKYVKDGEVNVVTATKGFLLNGVGADKWLSVAVLSSKEYYIHNSVNGANTGEAVRAGAIYACYGNNESMGITPGVTPIWKSNLRVQVGHAPLALATCEQSSIKQDQTIEYYYKDGGNWAPFELNDVSTWEVGTYEVHALAHDGNIYVRSEQSATLEVTEDAQTTTVYFKPIDDSTKPFKIRYDEVDTEMSIVDCDGQYYTAEIPNLVENFTFQDKDGNDITSTLTTPINDKVLYDMTSTNITKLYLNPNHWTKDGAWFAAYFYNDDIQKHEWLKMTDNNGIYECSIPTTNNFTHVIFCRMNKDNLSLGWDARWNQTTNLEIPNNGKNNATIKNEEWDGADVDWSTIYDDSKWTTAPTYNVTINIVGDGAITIGGNNYNSDATISNITLGDILEIGAITSVERWRFSNATTKCGDQEAEELTANSEINIYGSTTITVTFEQTLFSVNFDLNLPQGVTSPGIASQLVSKNDKATEPQVADADEHLFAGWYTDAACTPGKEYDFDTPVTEDITLYAKWIPYDDCIFFKNNLNWENVYVYFYSSDKYWDDWYGTGSKKDKELNGSSAHYRGFRGKMSKIGKTDIWYIDYIATAKKIDPTNWEEIEESKNVVFTQHEQYDKEWFWKTSVVRRGDFNKELPLYVPHRSKSYDKNDCAYHNHGLWMKYNSKESGYDWRGATSEAQDNPSWQTGKDFTADNPGGYSFTTMVKFGNSNLHYFKIHNAKSDWFGNGGTMTQTNCTKWIFGTDNSSNAKITPTVFGDDFEYIFTLYLGNGEVEVSLEYPLSTGDLRLAYKDRQADSFHPGHHIKKLLSDGTRIDTVSFFVWASKEPNKIILQTCTGFSNGDPIWGDNVEYDVSSNVNADAVYNFVLEQTKNGTEYSKKVNANETHLYTGDYYIRTDAAAGGWKTFRQEGNKMTYSSYADEHEDFDHYFCEWVSQKKGLKNVSYTVANDYSYCISDTLHDDVDTNHPIIVSNNEQDKKGNLPVKNGTLRNANVRWGWDSKTNKIRRAYLSGSSNVYDRFLVVTGNEHLLDTTGKALPAGTNGSPRYGLEANEDIFQDMGNWVYQVDVKASSQTLVNLTAKYNDQVQIFKGQNGDPNHQLLTSTSGSKLYKIRLMYDFKTNHLIVAWLANGSDGELGADMMVIRKNQEAATQIDFRGKTLSNVKYAYAVMTFTNNFVNGEDPIHARKHYWVSFPFDVNINEVFGFSEYMDHWILQLYDGQKRADEGWWYESGTFWKYITNKNYTLKKGVGYVLTLDLSKMGANSSVFKNTDEVSLYFPSTGEIGTISGTETVTTNVPEHTRTDKRENRHIYDSHWNIIGVPGFADISGYSTEETQEKPIINSDTEHGGGPSFYYEYLPASNSYQATTTENTFKTMYGYMVQYHGDLSWTTTVAESTPDKIAARRNSDYEKPEKVSLRLEIAQDDVMADQTFVQMQQEGASAEFDMNLDLTKIINSGANIYTLAGEQRIQSAGNALPMGEAIVPVGVNIATEGEYTFRMPDGTEGMVVELIDYETNTRTNLLLSDYTITLSAGSYENRFALHIQPEKDVTTGVGNVGDEAKGIEKYLIDGKLIIRTAEGIFDAQGHRL